MPAHAHNFATTQLTSQLRDPISAPEFAQIMAPFAGLLANERWAAAVSGGPDSMALAYLLAHWRQGKPGLAFIVDHALRANSGNEAKETKTALLALGLDAEILIWQHEAINARRHEVARKARFSLLLEACRRHGVKLLLFAHHAQDQAETVLMRLAKGSGVDGLAGIKSKTTRDGIQLLRPLLSVSKEQLLATCVQGKIAYVNDPSNTTETYARGRLRRVMPLLAQEGLSQASLLMLAKNAQFAKDAADHATLGLLRVSTHRDLSGAITGDLEQLRSAPFEIARRLLLAILQHLSSSDYPPRGASLEDLLQKLRQDEAIPGSTLHGAFVTKGLRSFTCMREHAQIKQSVDILPGQAVIFDARWQVTLPPDAPAGLTLAPLGFRQRQEIDRLAPHLRALVRQGRARACLPALFQSGKLHAIADFTTDRGMSVTASLLKSWPPLSLS